MLGRSVRVHEGRVLTVQRPAAPIGVGRIVIGIQNLDLIVVLEEDATIGAGLAVLVRHIGKEKLQVDLRASEFLLGIDVPRAGFAHHRAVAHRPRVGRSIRSCPL